VLIPVASAGALRVEEYRCEGLAGDSEERNDRHEIVFVRRGAFEVECGRGRAFVDAQRLLLFHRGERFRVRHPAGCGDRCLVLGFDDAPLAALLGAPAIDERRPEAPFRALALSCSRELYAAADRFRELLRRTPGDPLVAAEELLVLAAAALGAPAPVAPPGRTTAARAAAKDLADAVRRTLASRLGERLTLAELGAAVGVSPFHLARRFRAATRLPIHQYRLELRLREAHARLRDGADDLTTLALDLGFADHAHFTNAFRRRWGVAPSRLRDSRAERPISASRLRPKRRPTGAA
jgi:AraC family transcriptional regulator